MCDRGSAVLRFKVRGYRRCDEISLLDVEYNFEICCGERHSVGMNFPGMILSVAEDSSLSCDVLCRWGGFDIVASVHLWVN